MTALIHANINFLGGTLLLPIWYRNIIRHSMPRISFILPFTMSSPPGKIIRSMLLTEMVCIYLLQCNFIIHNEEDTRTLSLHNHIKLTPASFRFVEIFCQYDCITTCSSYTLRILLYMYVIHTLLWFPSRSFPVCPRSD